MGCIFEKKSGHKISETKGILYSRIREIFKDYILEITTTPRKFDLHSLRLDGGSGAANNVISGRLISKHGRWSSEKTTNGYIKDSVVKVLTVSNALRL